MSRSFNSKLNAFVSSQRVNEDNTRVKNNTNVEPKGCLLSEVHLHSIRGYLNYLGPAIHQFSPLNSV